MLDVTSVANAHPTDVPVAPAVYPDLAAPVAVGPIHRGWRDRNAKTREEPMVVVVVVVMVMMVLHQLQQRLRLPCLSQIIRDQHSLRVLHRLKQISVRVGGRNRLSIVR